VINATLRPLYPRERDRVSIVQEAGRAPGPVCRSAESLAFAVILFPEVLLLFLCADCPGLSICLYLQHNHPCPRWDSNPHALHSAGTGFGSSINRPTSQQRVAKPTKQSRIVFSTTEQVKAVRTENCSYRPRQWDSSSSQLLYASCFLPDETNVAGDSKRQTWWLRYGTKPSYTEMTNIASVNHVKYLSKKGTYRNDGRQVLLNIYQDLLLVQQALN
jgi:hypothetical protein